MAAALAYATLSQCPPCGRSSFTLRASFWVSRPVSGQIASKLSGAMGPQAAAQIQTMVTNVARTGRRLYRDSGGFAGLILSATSVLLQLQHCLNKPWKVRVVGSGLKHFAMQRVRSIFC